MKYKHIVFAMAEMGLCLRLFAEENAPLPPELGAPPRALKVANGC
jgi:hypothetical protein